MLVSGFGMERRPDSQSFCTQQSSFRGASQKNERTPRKCDSEFLAVSMEPRETVRKSDATRNWAKARKKLESHSMESQFFSFKAFQQKCGFPIFCEGCPRKLHVHVKKKNSRKRPQQHQASKQQHNHNKRSLLLDDVLSSAHSFPLFSGCWRSGFLRTRFP